MGIFHCCPNTRGQRSCSPKLTLLVEAIICLLLAGTNLYWWLSLACHDTMVYQIFYYGYLITIIFVFTIVIPIFIAICLPSDSRAHQGAALIFTLISFMNIFVILVSFICMTIHCATSNSTSKFVWATVGAGFLTLCSFFLFLDLNSYYENLSQ